MTMEIWLPKLSIPTLKALVMICSRQERLYFGEVKLFFSVLRTEAERVLKELTKDKGVIT